MFLQLLVVSTACTLSIAGPLLPVSNDDPQPTALSEPSDKCAEVLVGLSDASVDPKTVRLQHGHELVIRVEPRSRGAALRVDGVDASSNVFESPAITNNACGGSEIRIRAKEAIAGESEATEPEDLGIRVTSDATPLTVRMKVLVARD